ncbi:hypothetical protein B0H14DRAFT_2650488 [Mycena olivaceomarginata]|nr:hypothetical protein B0H14DRAFT_2650488 [Mycena olivaceomarginata]
MDPNYIDLDSDDEIAYRRILQIPTSLLSHLPPKTFPIARLLPHNLPAIAPAEDTGLEQMYTTEEPTQNIEDLLPFLAVPSRPTLQKMVNGFEQACADGKKSLHISVNPEIVYPLWGLMYLGEVLDASEAKTKWLRADHWLHQTGQTCEEEELKLRVRGIWSVVKWPGNLPGFASMPMDGLAKLFSSNYLNSRFIDAMLTLLLLWARLAGDETLIIRTTFSDFIRLLPPIIDGVPAGPIIASGAGQTATDKDAESVNNFRDHVEIGQRARRIFEELAAEKEKLAKAVASLNTVRRKGKANVNILEMDEEEEAEE